MREYVAQQILHALRIFLDHVPTASPPYGVALSCGTESAACALHPTLQSADHEDGDLMLHVPQSAGAIVCTGPLAVGGFPLITALNLNTGASAACVLVRYDRKLHSFQLKTLHPCEGSVWLKVGNFIDNAHCTAGMPAMILQCNSVFRVGTHIFKVTACPAVRSRMMFHHVVAPATGNHSLSRVCGDVAHEIEADEDAELHVTCLGPPTATCVNQRVKFTYSQGGHQLRIGTTEQCMFRIRDSRVGGVACRIVAQQGHFWLMDGGADGNRSVGGTFVQVCPNNITPLPVRSSFGTVVVYLNEYLVNLVVTKRV